jgi:hypothetical protein
MNRLGKPYSDVVRVSASEASERLATMALFRAIFTVVALFAIFLPVALVARGLYRAGPSLCVPKTSSVLVE